MSLDMLQSSIHDDFVPQITPYVPSSDGILRALFGPTRWQTRASVALRACVRHVQYVARGERPLTWRHVNRLLAVAEHRHKALETERRIAHEKVDALYDAGQKALLQARIDLKMLAESRRKAKR